MLEWLVLENDTIYMTKARDAQTGILPGQEPDGVRLFCFKLPKKSKRPALEPTLHV